MVVSSGSGRASGGALLIAVAVAVVAMVVGTAWLMPRGESDAARAAREAAAQAAFDERVVVVGQRIEAALRNQRDLTPMIEDLRALLAEAPEHADANRAIALAIAAEGGLPAESYDHLIVALDEGADAAELHAIAGNLAMQSDDAAAAIGHFEQAVALNADEPRFTRQLASAHAVSGDLDTALRLTDAWVARASDTPEPFLLRARLLTDAGRLGEAERALVAAEDRTLPDELETLRAIAIRRADLLGALGRHEEAVAALRLLPVEDQLLEEVAEALGEAWDRAGEPMKAAVYFDRVARLEMTATWAAREAGRRWLALGRADKAAEMDALLRSRGE
ncbi:MAG: tetratricopeptide repeat protein [Planctomycetota bacterium]